MLSLLSPFVISFCVSLLSSIQFNSKGFIDTKIDMLYPTSLRQQLIDLSINQNTTLLSTSLFLLSLLLFLTFSHVFLLSAINGSFNLSLADSVSPSIVVVLSPFPFPSCFYQLHSPSDSAAQHGLYVFNFCGI